MIIFEGSERETESLLMEELNSRYETLDISDNKWRVVIINLYTSPIPPTMPAGWLFDTSGYYTSREKLIEKITNYAKMGYKYIGLHTLEYCSLYYSGRFDLPSLKDLEEELGIEIIATCRKLKPDK